MKLLLKMVPLKVMLRLPVIRIQRVDRGSPETIIALGTDAENQRPGDCRCATRRYPRQLDDDAVVIRCEGGDRVRNLLREALARLAQVPDGQV
jgi:hypothetical protein